MAEANLMLMIQQSIERRNQLQLDISNFHAQKNLAAYSQADTNSILSSEKAAIRDKFKNLYNNSPELQEEYTDYTEITEYEEEIDKITAQIQDELERLSAWETSIDAQITTSSAELEEINAYLQSYQQMMTSNIQEDYNFGIGG